MQVCKPDLTPLPSTITICVIIILKRPLKGAFYHIIVRGNQRQDIFFDESDRHHYLEQVRRYKRKCGFILYAYVLMTNHVHLLIETPNDLISRIMQVINFTYTQ